METSAKTAVRIVHTSWLSINAKSPSSSDAQYLLVNNSSCCPHVLCYISKLNVNDIFLAIAKKLPKDGEGGAAGAGGIRWPELKFQTCWNLLLSWLFKFFSFKTKPLCSIVIIRISGPLREVATLPRALAATNNSCVTRTSEPKNWNLWEYSGLLVCAYRRPSAACDFWNLTISDPSP